MGASKIFTIAIAGNPNCGKTALFNALTGSRQRVGNWPGVTVEKKEGFLDLGGRQIRVVDLPGTYAIFANAEDERAAVDYLLSREASLIINIVDASNIERNLFLTSQLADMGIPMVIAVNMMDIAEKRGLEIDLNALSEAYGVPCISLSAVNDRSVTNFISEMAHILAAPMRAPKPIAYSDKIESVVKSLEPKVAPVAKLLNADNRWVALMYLGHDKSYADKFNEADVEMDLAAIAKELGEEPQFAMAESRYSKAHEIASQVIESNIPKTTFSDKLDSILLNRWLSLPVFLLIMYLVFWLAVTVGSTFIDFFDILFGAIFVDGLGYVLGDVLGCPAFVTAILASGVGAGIQTVSTFVPVIFFMFLCLSFLEDSGYMARGAFVADRFMRFLGLPGHAFVPMMVGFGCSVPGIMGSRILESKRERFLTIFLVPFMSCGARLPVYALFAAAFFGKQAGSIVFLLYLAGVLFAIVYGMILRRSLFQGQASNFVMELPPYHLPKMKSLLIHCWQRLRDYVVRAGKVITIAVAALGFLNSFGIVNGEFTAGNNDSENSLLAITGKAITPIFEPFGIEKENWPASVSLVTGLLAKEAVIGTMNSLYSMAEENSEFGVQSSELDERRAILSEAPAESKDFFETREESEVSGVRNQVSEDKGESLPPAPDSPVATPSSGDTPQRPDVDESLETRVEGTAATEDRKVAEPESTAVQTTDPVRQDGDEEKPLIAGTDECPAKEVEEGAPDIIGALVEALKSIPANLSGVLGGLTDPLGTSGALNKETSDEDADIYTNLRSYFRNGGHDGFNWQVFAFLIFILLYAPCLATMGVVIREIGPALGILMATLQTVIAWAFATLLYQIPVGGSHFWIAAAVTALIATVVFLKLFGIKANREKRFED